MPYPKKYKTAKELRNGCNRYFESISVERPRVIYEDSGERTNKGKPILRPVKVKDKNGKPMKEKVWLEEPSLYALCLSLRISQVTWASYSSDPALKEVCAWAKLVIESRLVQLLTTREKGTDGIKFNLANNFGWKDKKDIGITGSVEDFLRSLDDNGEEQEM